MSDMRGKIAFASGKQGDYDIWTLDVPDGRLQQVSFGAHWNDKPAWSPCGQWIAFISNRSGFQEIYKVEMLDAGPGEPIQLTQLNKWCDAPRFSPDGDSIAYISNEAGNNDIWIMDADGENRRQISTHEGDDTHVEWTVDGRGLLWSSDRDQGDADIWHFDLASGQRTQLTNEVGADIDPVQSPCGNLIAFVSNRPINPIPGRKYSDRDKDLWLMRSDGTYPVKLTDHQGCDFCPSWSPDGNYILYASNQDRSASHLRVLDVSDLVSAYAADDARQIINAADALRSEPISLERSRLQSEIGAHRRTTFVTQWMPQRWVEACYPPGFFGQERNPHWIDPELAGRHVQFSGSQSARS
jgi:Tol biopolymer transport system component